MPLSANEEMLLTVANSLPEELKDHVVFPVVQSFLF